MHSASICLTGLELWPSADIKLSRVPGKRFHLVSVTTAAFALTIPSVGQAKESTITELEARIDAQQVQIEQLKSLLAAQAARSEGIRQSLPPPPINDQAPANPSTAESQRDVVAAAREAFEQDLDISGDLRVRQEWNIRDGRDRSRQTLRARLRGRYDVSSHISVGGQIVTGDPDDPNSTDITLSNFLDDLTVSLDQAWVRYSAGPFSITAGKFAQPFVRTDLVWDADVSPQGLTLGYRLRLSGSSSIEARGLYFVVDESAGGPDSDMIGGQFVATVWPTSNLALTLAASYYHYRLGSLTGADAGDFRGNVLIERGYLSKFRLADGLVTLNWSGLHDRWPISLTLDAVHNFGAAVPADAGVLVELAAGKTGHRGDVRINYTYGAVEADAVFAAFSHDNIELSTNYKMHGLGVGYNVSDQALIDLALYRYRPLDGLFAGTLNPSSWLNRARLNLTIGF